MKTALGDKVKTIRIRPDSGGFYQAVFKSEILSADYCLRFKSTITGAIALFNFSEMIGKHYGEAEVDFSFMRKDNAFESLFDSLRGSYGKRRQR